MPQNKKQSATAKDQIDKIDPCGIKTPMTDIEGLVAIVDNKKDLRQKLIEMTDYHKRMKIDIL